MVGAITALVGTEGHQVITAYDGLTAVRRFREERPDLVLLDLAMPGPDGFTVIGQMRARATSRSSSCRARAPRRRRCARWASAPTTTSSSRSASGAAGADRRGDASRGLAGTGHVGGRRRRPGGRPDGRLADARARRATRRASATIQLDLTPIEFRLLEALVRAGGDLVAHHRLVRAGWPAEPDPDLLWLKPHLARLRSKLRGVGGPQIVAVRRSATASRPTSLPE